MRFLKGDVMETVEEIEKALLDNKLDLEHRIALEMPLYECAGDYVRGWIAALEWILGKEA